mmetsp:Transcript_17870/g.40303  ORF Transcript_17870/g.40303 Transcript_17870/m.40303 type:complete len:139 (+) Transcript_17870:131-547(+)
MRLRSGQKMSPSGDRRRPDGLVRMKQDSLQSTKPGGDLKRKNHPGTKMKDFRPRSGQMKRQGGNRKKPGCLLRKKQGTLEGKKHSGDWRRKNWPNTKLKKNFRPRSRQKHRRRGFRKRFKDEGRKWKQRRIGKLKKKL